MKNFYKKKNPRKIDSEIKDVFKFYNMSLLKENLVAKALGIRKKSPSFPFLAAWESIHCEETEIKGVLYNIREKNKSSYCSKLCRMDQK